MKPPSLISSAKSNSTADSSDVAKKTTEVDSSLSYQIHAKLQKGRKAQKKTKVIKKKPSSSKKI